jgi:murein DD-endopeptidase MepM/ murein hydrolase activator NlpD
VRLPKAPSAASGRRTLHAITSTPAAVVGVAAVAVAAVGGLKLPANADTTTTDAAAQPTSGLEQNLLQMRAASANLADRATRSEQRSELAMQQALEKQRLAEMAPKYFLPVQDYILTAGFGDAGAHWANLHTGQDFAVPEGTRVVAITDGTVVEAGWAGAFGYRIVIQHPDGSQTWYCHLSVMKVKSGPVKAGQLIALSGDTGNSTGPHLHFEYHPPGPADPSNGVPGASTAVNPIPFLRAHGLIA